MLTAIELLSPEEDFTYTEIAKRFGAGHPSMFFQIILNGYVLSHFAVDFVRESLLKVRTPGNAPLPCHVASLWP
jgi:hypothetical protein